MLQDFNHRDTEDERQAPRYLPLENRTLLLCVSGGIAVFKAAGYARKFMECGARVQTVMTENACRFVTPLTFAALTGEKVHSDSFEETDSHRIPHISLAREADLMLHLPATANILAKAANGIADDLVSTIYLAFSGPVIFCPSMNPLMYAHQATQDNIAALRRRGHRVVDAAFGGTACGERGQGRLACYEDVKEAVIRSLTPQSLRGLRVLVTAGPTREPIDPVRFISNRSSGKMGYAIAVEAGRRGGSVTLVTGPCALQAPSGVKTVAVTTAAEMEEAVKDNLDQADIIIMSAAVADYAPEEQHASKIKKGASDTISIRLRKTKDILAQILERRRDGQFVVGFCAETGDLEKRALEKIARKPVDLLVANDVTEPGAGFDVDTNRVMLVDRDYNIEKLPLLSKEEVAVRILNQVESGLS